MDNYILIETNIFCHSSLLHETLTYAYCIIFVKSNNYYIPIYFLKKMSNFDGTGKSSEVEIAESNGNALEITSERCSPFVGQALTQAWLNAGLHGSTSGLFGCGTGCRTVIAVCGRCSEFQTEIVISR